MLGCSSETYAIPWSGPGMDSAPRVASVGPTVQARMDSPVARSRPTWPERPDRARAALHCRGGRVRPFGQNAYVAWLATGTDAIVVDPGFDARSILQLLGDRKLAAILDTHGHVDHIAGNAALKQAYPHAPL